MNKEDFPIFLNNKDLVYLDSSATSLKPIKVIEEINNYYIENIDKQEETDRFLSNFVLEIKTC